ncbi:MAG: DUF5654 family protein [archaeon]
MKIEVIEKLAALLTAAFGLVAALAWNDTIKAIFAVYFGEVNTIWAMLTYALLVTIIAVIVTIHIGKFEQKANKKEAKEKKKD